MSNSNDHVSEKTSRHGSIPDGEVPEDDFIVALSQEIEAIGAEIEEQTRKREHLLQWRQRLLDKQ